MVKGIVNFYGMRGRFREIQVKEQDQKQGPAQGKNWIVLMAKVHHITASTTIIDIRNKESGRKFFKTTFNSGIGTDDYPLFNQLVGTNEGAEPGYNRSQAIPLVLDDTLVVYISSGGTGVYIDLWVFEWGD